MLLFQGEHSSAKDHGVVKLGKEVESQSNGEDIFECLVRLKKIRNLQNVVVKALEQILILLLQ